MSSPDRQIPKSLAEQMWSDGLSRKTPAVAPSEDEVLKTLDERMRSAELSQKDSLTGDQSDKKEKSKNSNSLRERMANDLANEKFGFDDPAISPEEVAAARELDEAERALAIAERFAYFDGATDDEKLAIDSTRAKFEKLVALSDDEYEAVSAWRADWEKPQVEAKEKVSLLKRVRSYGAAALKAIKLKKAGSANVISEAYDYTPEKTSTFLDDIINGSENASNKASTSFLDDMIEQQPDVTPEEPAKKDEVVTAPEPIATPGEATADTKSESTPESEEYKETEAYKTLVNLRDNILKHNIVRVKRAPGEPDVFMKPVAYHGTDGKRKMMVVFNIVDINGKSAAVPAVWRDPIEVAQNLARGEYQSDEAHMEAVSGESFDTTTVENPTEETVPTAPEASTEDEETRVFEQVKGLFPVGTIINNNLEKLPGRLKYNSTGIQLKVTGYSANKASINLQVYENGKVVGRTITLKATELRDLFNSGEMNVDVTE